MLTIPDVGDRYLSVMVVNEDHYVNEVLHSPGRHELTVGVHGTEFVSLTARIFVDPADPEDVAVVNETQDGFRIEAASSRPFTHPEYDPRSFDATRTALLALSEGLADSRAIFGRRDEVDPVRHLLGTAFGWGGLAEHEAYYTIESAPRPVSHHRITFRDVPVDGFWSISIYNRDGFFETNRFDSNSRNGVTTVPEPDGSVTIDLDSDDHGYRNHLYVMDGWNYAIRLYRPRAEILDGTWTAPVPEPV